MSELGEFMYELYNYDVNIVPSHKNVGISQGKGFLNVYEFCFDTSDEFGCYKLQELFDLGVKYPFIIQSEMEMTRENAEAIQSFSHFSVPFLFVIDLGNESIEDIKYEYKRANHPIQGNVEYTITTVTMKNGDTVVFPIECIRVDK